MSKRSRGRGGQLVLVTALHRRDKFGLRRKDAGKVRVSHEAVSLDFAKQDLHLALVKNMLWKDVLVRRITGRTVNEHEFAFVLEPWQLAKKIPSIVRVGDRTDACVELVPRPVNRLECHRVKAVWIKQGGLVMVTEDRDLGIPANEIEALAGIWAIADDIAKAINLVDSDRAYIIQHRLECFEVSMDVAD